jgi:hypothetical protein
MRLLAACLTLLAAHAHAFPQLGQDITDLWWNPAESGWGMNVVEQSDTSFITLFVYGTGNAPTWFAASSVTYQGYDSASLEHVHSGTLYQTTGPVVSTAAFDPAQVGVRAVGLITLRVGTSTTANTVYTGRLSYTVDGVAVEKTVVRQVWRNANHAGTYYAALRESWSNCSTSGYNGDYVGYGTLTVTQSSDDPPALSISFASSDGTYAYVFAGNYYQAGRSGVVPFGSVTTYDTSGATGTGSARILDIASGSTGIAATLALSGLTGYSGCTISLRLAASR